MFFDALRSRSTVSYVAHDSDETVLVLERCFFALLASRLCCLLDSFQATQKQNE